MRKRRRNRPKSWRQRFAGSARTKTRVYLNRGKLVRQPCEVCGEAKTQPHHDDYSKALEVRWLCRPCHRDHHARCGPGLVPEEALEEFKRRARQRNRKKQ